MQLNGGKKNFTEPGSCAHKHHRQRRCEIESDEVHSRVLRRSINIYIMYARCINTRSEATICVIGARQVFVVLACN